jgi:diguanylate cyclase (GGDEF)-like protein
LEASNAHLAAAKNELEAVNARALSLAAQDSLTGLPNRRIFNERLAEASRSIQESGESFAILCVDLDRFKLVNDLRGHLVGDALLVQVADRLRRMLRKTDLAARFGGDEFVILQAPAESPLAASILARRVVDELSQPYEIEGQQITIGATVGVALAPNHGRSPRQLLQNADTALYRAKENGRNRFRLFEPAMDLRVHEQRLLEQDLRNAINAEQLELQYQPIYDCRSGELTRLEALLRWKHPDRGIIRPGDFIPIAEQSDLIVKLGRWVLNAACVEATRWPERVRLAVNFSPAQFLDPELAEHLRAILKRTSLRPERLELEVTEGLLVQDTQEVIGKMRELRALGIRIALDDFGTGYASLSYLRRLRFDSIKIDKSFLESSEEPGEARAVIDSILQLASSLRLSVVAEGVENEQQLQWLQQSKCNELQGFLLGRPMGADSVRELLSRVKAELRANAEALAERSHGESGQKHWRQLEKAAA